MGATQDVPVRFSKKGAFASLGAALFYALAALMVKVSSDTFSMMEILWGRGLLQLLFVGIVFAIRRDSPWGPAELRPLLIARGIMGVASIFCYFLGIVLLSVADSVSLFSIKPIVAALLGACFLSEPLRQVHGIAALLSFAGCLLIARTKPSEAHSDLHMPRFIVTLVVLLGAALAAGVDVVIRRIMTRAPLLPEVPVWYFCIVDVFLLAVATPLLRNTFFAEVPDRGSRWYVVALVGVAVFSVLGQQCMTLAFRYVSVAFGALLIQTETVMAFILQFVVFHHMEFQSFCGASLITIGASVLACSELRRKAPEATEQADELDGPNSAVQTDDSVEIEDKCNAEIMGCYQEDDVAFLQ